MANHPRTQIRQAIKTKLATPTGLVYPTAAGAKVFDSFNRPWPDDPTSAETFYPAILINTGQERVGDEQKTCPDMRRRELTVDIYGMVVGSIKDDLDLSLDALALEIEKAMNAYYTIGGLAESSSLSDTSTVVEQGARLLIGVVKLSYEVNYWTRTIKAVGTPGTLPFTVFTDA
jgi:hypothetical protein